MSLSTYSSALALGLALSSPSAIADDFSQTLCTLPANVAHELVLNWFNGQLESVVYANTDWSEVEFPLKATRAAGQPSATQTQFDLRDDDHSETVTVDNSVLAGKPGQVTSVRGTYDCN